MSSTTVLETCTLKVHLNCVGCIRKVKKLLRRIEGVYKVDVDAEEQKVTVTGMVDPAILVHKLERSGKHAEVWSVPNEEQTVQTSEDNNNLEQMVNIHGSSEMQMLPDFGSIGDSFEHQHYSNQDNGENLMVATLAQTASVNGNHTLHDSVVPVGLQGHCPPNLMSNFQAAYPSYIQRKTMPLYYYNNHLPEEVNIYREDGLARHHMMMNHNTYPHY